MSHIGTLLKEQIDRFNSVRRLADHFEKLLIKHGLPLPDSADYQERISKACPEFIRLTWEIEGFYSFVTISQNDVCLLDYENGTRCPFDYNTTELPRPMVAAIMGVPDATR